MSKNIIGCNKLGFSMIMYNFLNCIFISTFTRCEYSPSIFKCYGCNEWNLDSRYCYSNIDIEQIYCLNCVNIKPQAFEEYRTHYNPNHPRLKGVLL